MNEFPFRRSLGAAVLAAACATLATLYCAPPVLAQAGATGVPDADALTLAKQARQLAAQGRYADAIELHQRALVLAKAQFGGRHEVVAYLLDDLAAWRYREQRFDEALELSRQAVDIVAEAKGADSVEHATLLNNLGSILSNTGRTREAAARYEQSLAIFVRHYGPNHERSAQLARNLGAAYVELSRFDEAEPRFAAAVAANRAMHGENLDTARALLDLAGLRLRLEQTRDARAQAEQAQRIVARVPSASATDVAAVAVTLAQADIHESRLDAARDRLDAALFRLDAADGDHQLARASVLFNLGWVHILRRQAVEAEHVYKEALAVYRRVSGTKHPAVGRTLHSLAIVYQDLGQFDQAERFYRQAIDIFVASFGETDASVAATRLEYASLLTEQGRPDSGQREAQAALQIYDRLPGASDLKRGYAHSFLALAQHHAGDLAAAEASYARALELIGKVRGAQSSDLAPGLTDLARIQRTQGRIGDAERALQQALLIREKDAAATPAGLAETLSELANLRLAQGRPGEALASARKAVQIAARRLETTQQSLSLAVLGEQRQARGLYEQFLETARTVQASPSLDLLAEMFETAQLPHLSGTSDAVNRMAARFAAGESRLARLVRERQDAVERWRALDRYIVERLTRMQGRSFGAGEELEARAALAQLGDSIERFDARVRREFPRYADLTDPRPVALGAVQPLLAADEALLLQVTSAQATYVFLVTRSTVDFARTTLDKRQLQQAVDALRKGLDLQNVRRPSDLPPFDTDAAHLLYRGLFEPFAQRLKGVKHIVAVQDQAMQNLPLSVLIATPAPGPPKRLSELGRLDFLSRHYAFSVVPSVGSFVLLRSVTQRSRGARPFVGFGDPDLEGGEGSTPTRSALVRALATEIDPAALRKALVPLPETRDELKAVARYLEAGEGDLYFRDRASEGVLKQMDLSRYRIVGFATHGLLAGEFRGLAEPALVLTPPRDATPDDDGLLTASEIATLHLDADWILLSACNTAAAAGRGGAEGLSGLAKAFFYAGSRALLVSHWWVASEATTQLMIGSIQALAAEPAIGRAEALRRGMLGLLDGKADPTFVHPVFWAPFTNVGEGGRAR